jgi:hypothetical protein
MAAGRQSATKDPLWDSHGVPPGGASRAGLVRWAPLLAFLWPLAFFVDRIVPWDGTIRATGNDFYYLYYVYKAYLLDSLASMRLPLWSPAEAAGYPFYASPFAQVFYPLNLPLAGFYAVAGGYSSHDHQVFVALGTALFSLGCFLWLRSLGNSAAAALFGACLVSTGFRFADILRFPNAVHTALWYPWILLSLERVFAAERRRELARWLLLLGVAALGLLTAGYLYYVYYSIFLFGPYLVLARSGIGGIAVASWRRLGLCTGVGAGCLALCAPYLLKVKQMLDATAGRDVARDLPIYAFGWKDAANSLVFPMGASPEGCLYFGTAGLLLLVSYGHRALRGEPSERRLFTALLGWYLVVTWISCGEGPLFTLLMQALPGFSRLRVWGRLGIVLLPLLGWLLARAFDSFQARLGTRSRKREAPWLVVGVYALVLAAQAGQLWAGDLHAYYHVHMPELRGLASWALVGGALGAAVVLGLHTAARVARPGPAVTLAALLAASAADVRPVASRLWSQRSAVPQRRPLQVSEVLARSLHVPRRPRGGTLPIDQDPAGPGARLSPSFNLAVIPEWYFQRYWDFLERTAAEPAQRAYLLGAVDGRRVFTSARVDHVRVEPFLEDAAAFGGSTAVLQYTGDRLRLQVEMPCAGFVTFVDNWDPDWRAFVDGRSVPLVLPFGTFKAAPVAEGRHRVLFEYAPRFRFTHRSPSP